MVGARAAWSQIAAEAGPVGEGPFFPFSFGKNIVLLFFCGQVLSVRQNGGGGCLVRASPAAPAARLVSKLFCVQTILLFWLLLLNWACEKGAFGCLYCEQKNNLTLCLVQAILKKSGRKGKKLRSKRYVWLSSSLFIKKCFDAVFWSGQFRPGLVDEAQEGFGYHERYP